MPAGTHIKAVFVPNIALIIKKKSPHKKKLSTATPFKLNYK